MNQLQCLHWGCGNVCPLAGSTQMSGRGPASMSAVNRLMAHHLMLACEFAKESLRNARFCKVHHVAYHRMASICPEIIELDYREERSFYVKAFK